MLSCKIWHEILVVLTLLKTAFHTELLIQVRYRSDNDSGHSLTRESCIIVYEFCAAPYRSPPYVVSAARTAVLWLHQVHRLVCDSILFLMTDWEHPNESKKHFLPSSWSGSPTSFMELHKTYHSNKETDGNNLLYHDESPRQRNQMIVCLSVVYPCDVVCACVCRSAGPNESVWWSALAQHYTS